MLTSAYLSVGLDDVPTRKKLLDDYGIEVGGGLGKAKGKIWRVGLMGEACRFENIYRLVLALKEILG